LADASKLAESDGVVVDMAMDMADSLGLSERDAALTAEGELVMLESRVEIGLGEVEYGETPDM